MISIGFNNSNLISNNHFRSKSMCSMEECAFRRHWFGLGCRVSAAVQVLQNSVLRFTELITDHHRDQSLIVEKLTLTTVAPNPTR
jgi:hypothetical protein